MTRKIIQIPIKQYKEKSNKSLLYGSNCNFYNHKSANTKIMMLLMRVYKWEGLYMWQRQKDKLNPQKEFNR